jgi:hypothetical protein
MSLAINYKDLINNLFINHEILRIIFSSQIKKDKESFTKVQLIPYLKDNNYKYQFTYYYTNSVKHKNLELIEATNETINLITLTFKQALITLKDKEYHLLNNKGKVTIIEKKLDKEINYNLTHNNEKQYLIKDNVVVPFLVELGVMNVKGKVLNDKYDKFKQINRFLEFVDDIVNEFDNNKVIKIIDFGCGKSYLTFAIHYYLTQIKKFKVDIVGLDLKENVINECNNVVSKYNLEGIKFKKGDIKDYKDSYVDMVVTLHACDTATDYALYNAIKWNAKVILSVPCCQHEVNHQIKASNLEGLTQYGIIKERLSALITDVSRVELLEINGYKSQILEFIDIENTPKNLLIRAIKRDKDTNTSKYSNQLENLKKEFNYKITLEKLLETKS